MIKKTVLTVASALTLSLSVAAPAFADGDSAAQFKSAHSSFFSLLNSDPTTGGVSYLFQPGNSEKDGPGEFDLHQFDLGAELPVPLDEDSYLRFGGNYNFRILNFDSVRTARTNQDSENLHKLMLTLGAGTFLSENLLITGGVHPGLLSDLDDGLRNDDFDVYGEAMAVYRINPGAQLLLGAARAEVFESTAYYPLAGLRLQSEDGSLDFSITIPHEIRIAYSATEYTQLYGGFWLSGAEYRMDMGESERFNLHVQDRRIGLGAIYWLDNNFNVRAEGGMTVDSEFEFKTDEPGQFNGSLDNAGYFTVGLGFAL